jgi:hypothetical protein
LSRICVYSCVRAALVIGLFVPALATNVFAQTLPPPWATGIVGNPSLAGSATYGGSTFTVSGGGYDIWGTSDQFRFVYQPVTGDINIIARVSSVTNTNPWTKAGIMVRQSLATGSAHAAAFATPANGIAFQSRPTANGSSLHTSAGSGQAPVWLKLERRGSTISAFRSTNGSTWTPIGQQTLTLPSTYYVGLAVTSHDNTRAATGTFDNVMIQSAGTPSNPPPAVSLTAPAAGATYTAPASVTVTATASDTGGSVTKVDFYAGTTLIGTDTTSPYSATWSNVAAGTYVLTAVARDNLGATTTSAGRSVSVTGGSNQSPNVSMTTPAAGAIYKSPASIVIAATASDADGAVTRVDFYAGATLIGSDTTSPYGMTWTGMALGAYPLTAVARDNSGATTVSSTRDVTVVSATMPTQAIFTPSSNQATTVNRYVLEIFPAGANPLVASPVGTQDLGLPAIVGGQAQADVTQTILALAPGNYIATVTAVGTAGSTRSAASPAFTR